MSENICDDEILITIAQRNKRRKLSEVMGSSYPYTNSHYFRDNGSSGSSGGVLDPTDRLVYELINYELNRHRFRPIERPICAKFQLTKRHLPDGPAMEALVNMHARSEGTSASFEYVRPRIKCRPGPNPSIIVTQKDRRVSGNVEDRLIYFPTSKGRLIFPDNRSHYCEGDYDPLKCLTVLLVNAELNRSEDRRFGSIHAIFELAGMYRQEDFSMEKLLQMYARSEGTDVTFEYYMPLPRSRTALFNRM